MECGLVGDRKFVRSCGQASPLRQAVDASFDGVALLVRLGIEAGWATAPVAPSRSGADLAGRLRDDLADARRRRWLRTAREEYGRSARTTRGRVRGLPTPLRGTRMRDITVSKAGASRPGLL